jgi:hypothetical protein
MKFSFSSIVTTSVALSVLSTLPAVSAQAITFAGSWHVGDGPNWPTAPQVYSALDAAALLFGGSATDYAISTISSDSNTINHLAFVDGYGDPQYLNNPASESFSGSLPTYSTYGAYSAYVHDNSCFNRYGNLGQSCDSSDTHVNYAFRLDAQAQSVPEPFTVIGSLVGGTAALRMRKKLKSSKNA